MTIAQKVVCQDSVFRLNLTDFLLQLKENHPLAMVAQNDVLIADQVIKLAKGSFDPRIIGDFDQKYYDGTTYYSTLSTGVKIPTRLGWTINAMGDWNRGAFINPIETIPSEGLTYLGVSVPIGRGMFTDEQRTQLRQAMVAYQQSKVERQLVLNDLLYDAGKQFIEWQEQYAQLQVTQELVTIARLRLDQITENVRVGERAEVDTIEASAQLYMREAELTERLFLEKQARLRVENYLWDKGVRPLSLANEARPVELSNAQMSANEEEELHPLIVSYRLQLNQLELERKLKIEQLKPGLTVHYNILQPASEVFSTNYSFRNYKWGATLYMPLFLRKERAGLAITNLKMANNNLELNLKQRDLNVKVEVAQAEWLAFREQSEWQRQTAERLEQVTNAEQALFNNGESSLLVINLREMSYLQAQNKFLESLAKSVKARLSIQYYNGSLGK
jgi:outer membrane protein TolC